MTILAITPARGGSKGIFRKNIKHMAGKPLIQHTIETVHECPLIDRYIVNSEDKEIRCIAESLGVETQDRPDDFFYDNTFQEVDRLLMWAVRDLEKKGAYIDIVVLLYATAPLRPYQAINGCIDLVLNQGYDSALTLYEDRIYLWERVDQAFTVTPTNYDPQKRGPNQLECWNQWIENKAVYVVKRNLLMETGCRLGGNIGFVEMNKEDSIDIDKPEEFSLAEQIMFLRQNS